MPSSAFSTLAALPGTPAPAAVRMNSRQRTRASQAESGRILSRAYGGQYFEVTLVYPPMKRSDAAPLIAFLQSRRGRDSVFKVELSGFRVSAGTDVANFGNYDDDTKLHLITATSPALETFPDARASGGQLHTDTVYMRASLSRDAQQIALDRDGLIRLEIDLVERL